MNTCKSCKWWAVNWNVDHNKIADCDFVNNIQPAKDTSVMIEATATDDSGLEAVLMTGENFGCIHHSPKY